MMALPRAHQLNVCCVLSGLDMSLCGEIIVLVFVGFPSMSQMAMSPQIVSSELLHYSVGRCPLTFDL